MANKFDFRTAEKLVEMIDAAAAKLDVKNGQMEKYFAVLHDSFKDEGYEAFSTDMSLANKAIGEVILELKKTGGKIAAYAEKLQELQGL